MLLSATSASAGMVWPGQFVGSRNQRANFSRLVTWKGFPSRKREKNPPLEATIVATVESDLPPALFTASSYASAMRSSAKSYPSSMTNSYVTRLENVNVNFAHAPTYATRHR